MVRALIALPQYLDVPSAGFDDRKARAAFHCTCLVPSGTLRASISQTMTALAP